MHRPPCATWLSWSRRTQTSVSCVLQSTTLSTLQPAKMGQALATGSKLISFCFSHHTLRPRGGTYSFTSMSPAHTKKKVPWLMGPPEHLPFLLHICSFTSTTPAKWTTRGYGLMPKEVKGQMHFTSRFLSKQRQGLSQREDGGGNLRRANVVLSTCQSCFPAPYSPPVTAPYTISGCDSANLNWITGLFFLPSSTPGTAEEVAQGPWASSMAHQSTPWSKTLSMRGWTPLCLGLRVSRLTTALWVSWSLKKMVPMSIKSLKTWLLRGAHVAKTETNMSFFWFLFYRLNWNTTTDLNSHHRCSKVGDALTGLSDFINEKKNIYINVREQSDLEQKCLLNVFCKKKKKEFYHNENLILFCFCYDMPVQPVVC